MTLKALNGNLHKVLFENMINGLAYCRIIYDEAGKALDWEYVSVNPAFEKQTGLKDAEGKRVSELIPGLLESNPRVLETYARVARTMRYEHFEQYVGQLGMWFNISVYSFEVGTFAAVFENTTIQKRLIYELERVNKEILRVYDETLQSWAKALEYRDKETEGHSMRVVDLTDKLAGKMGYNEKERIEFRRGALLHDIGKMAISEAIMNKPGKLDAEERDQMSQHPQIAYDILFQIKFLEGYALDIPYCHHELWDGSGYPRGLKEREIPACARLFTVVDVYDALTSDRPYRKALSKKFSLTYISENSGKLYDPKVVKAFLEMMDNEPQ